ncbi:MAG: tryptophan--tRNA ligase [Myxococcales bacterium]|nr:tryptophan--tRNA ligase [Myxococcales bacterium]MCB9668164.1 tryptophan--tRNA ligase [Alphaproteobacteria bacterium]MCB9692503.1 tryptophan--tRNA ligase [Alphaproteobacteria bacterium]
MRSLTGIKPTGDIHMGNLLGSVLPALALQEKYTAYYFIADYHALTTARDPDGVRRASREVAATFLAFGLDIEKNVLFRQSDVPVVCELAWILACQMGAGVIDRGHAVKAARDGGHDITAGTMFYPVLMAADILLYDSAIVPVGKDQKQHVEIARDIAVSINHHYGAGTLVVPEVSIQAEVGVVPGLDGRKMSKSYGNAIPIWSTSKQLRKTCMKIVTDSLGVDDAKDPDTDNVFNLYKLFATPEQREDLAARYRAGGLGYGHAKQELFEVIDALLADKRPIYEHWIAHPEELDALLAAGGERARATADARMDVVRRAVGLR